jgi:hypothetical protein
MSIGQTNVSPEMVSIDDELKSKPNHIDFNMFRIHIKTNHGAVPIENFDGNRNNVEKAIIRFFELNKISSGECILQYWMGNQCYESEWIRICNLKSGERFNIQQYLLSEEECKLLGYSPKAFIHFKNMSEVEIMTHQTQIIFQALKQDPHVPK